MTQDRFVMCHATPDEPHPADGTRTGLCEFHYREYRKAANKYSAMLSRYRNGEGPDPGDKATWERNNIVYTRLGDRWTAISPEQRHQLRNALIAQSAAMAPLPALLTEEGVYSLLPADIASMVRRALEAHGITMSLVEEIAQEPEK